MGAAGDNEPEQSGCVDSLTGNITEPSGGTLTIDGFQLLKFFSGNTLGLRAHRGGG
jgi:hypothetical protein